MTVSRYPTTRHARAWHSVALPLGRLKTFQGLLLVACLLSGCAQYGVTDAAQRGGFAEVVLPDPVAWQAGLAIDESDFAEVLPPRPVMQRSAVAQPQRNDARFTEDGWVTEAVQAQGIERRLFRSRTLGTDVSYHIYLPREYATEPGRRFPVIYWLHGLNAGERALRTMAGHFDAAMRAGHIPPALVVFPHGRTAGMWVNSRDGKSPIETLLIDELLPQIDANFRTQARREGRLIEGFSMGGYGAARLGFKYPHLFGSVSMFGAGPVQPEMRIDEGPAGNREWRVRVMEQVFGGEQAHFRREAPWTLAERNAAELRSGLNLRMVVGSEDAMLAANRELNQHLERLGIPLFFCVVPGARHNPLDLFERMGETNWGFYRRALGDGAGAAPAVPASVCDNDLLAMRPQSAPDASGPMPQGRMQGRSMRGGGLTQEQREVIAQRLRSFDHNRDGHIRREDLLPPGQQVFDRIDQNRDGVIDPLELNAFLRR